MAWSKDKGEEEGEKSGWQKRTRQLDGIILFPLQNIQKRIYKAGLCLGLRYSGK